MIKGVVRRPRGGIAVLDKKGVTLLRFDVLTTKKSSYRNIIDEDDESMAADNATAAADYYEDADEFTSENIIQHLNALIAWELRRRDYITTLGLDDDDTNDNVEDESIVDEYDDDDTTTIHNTTPRGSGGAGTVAGRMISAQAQKIQHFAQREIELQRLKKDRDTRKGKYVRGG
jgi:hypothetical protein